MACSQCQLYEAEIKRLKRALAEAHLGGKLKPLTSAERVRKFREKHKNGKQEFRG